MLPLPRRELALLVSNHVVPRLRRVLAFWVVRRVLALLVRSRVPQLLPLELAIMVSSHVLPLLRRVLAFLVGSHVLQLLRHVLQVPRLRSRTVVPVRIISPSLMYCRDRRY